MVGLQLLKHTSNLSDEEVVAVCFAAQADVGVGYAVKHDAFDLDPAIDDSASAWSQSTWGELDGG